jgi:hypothetical protein
MLQVQPTYLGFAEIAQFKLETDIKGGLANIVNEQVRFGRNHHDQVEFLPLLVVSPPVMPGAYQAKEILVKGRAEQIVSLVHCQNQRCLKFGQNDVFEKISELVLRPQ